MKLVDTQTNKVYVITELAGSDGVCRRLLDMGFAPGSTITRETDCPFGSGVLVTLRGRQVALRHDAASLINVESAYA